jgi:thiol-disulfide isomerase/thioredoxin
MSIRVFLALAAAASLVVSAAPSPLGADETQAAAPPAGQTPNEPAGDMYTLPETDDISALTRFLGRLLDFQPSSRAEDVLHRKKAPLAVRKASERILALEKDTSSSAYRMAKRVVLTRKASDLLNDERASVGDRKVILDEIIKFVAAGNKSRDDFRLASGYATGLEYIPARDLASEAYTKLGQIFVESKNPDMTRRGKMMLGAARRLNFIGQPFALKGVTLDGQPLDIASLRGKVVLVDFWATWCEPCLQEHPNLRKNYAAYKDRGFEIVGVSLDDDRPALEEYVADKKLPWITLHDKENLGEHPAVIDYGIFGLPCVVLIDKEGKVVSTRAFGAELGRLLKDQLGAP